ncbi:MAG TPA: tetratricopeptide repeat-containing glycosyltransferase family protein [Verrucomicrobiae bacterium]|nr:tetratricopeptide repeat-containing glycosyltransferase family protein [Verrucomicrobiae bacterium]
MKSIGEDLDAAIKAYRDRRYDDAEAACRAALRDAPKDGQACFLLGMVLHKTGRDKEAIQWLSQAAEIQPESAKVFSGLGCAHYAMGDDSRAADCFAQSIRLDPQHADAYYSMGNACYRMGQLERAVTLYRTAVELNPRDEESWNNLGTALEDLNRVEEAIAAYDRALEIRPDYARCRGNRAVALLAAGRLGEGFREYEWRWCRNNHRVPSRPYPQPVWGGEPMDDQTLFIHAEQGFGDMIQFVRFAPLARARVARVILECQKPLQRLFQFCGCAHAVITPGETPPPFDRYIPLVSLARVLRITLDTIPNKTPYLVAPPIADLPSVAAGCYKVGLAWTGDPRHHHDATRSIPLEKLVPLLQAPGITFFSLQVPVPARDRRCLRSLPRVVDLSGRLTDFYDTAAVIGQLDLVISVDTAVAHLAGALGKPTWTLLPHCADWRWLRERSDTPWYPTMRLLRQPRSGDWESLIRLATEQLHGFFYTGP